MAKDLEYKIKVKDGIIEFPHREKMRNDAKLLDDGNYTFKIQKVKKVRSSPLNRYYFGVIVKLVRQGLIDLGNRIELKETDKWITEFLAKSDPKTTHEYIKDLFIEKIIVDEDSGEIIQNEISTKKMSNTEFIAYYTPVYQWAKEFLGIDIPEPNEEFELPNQYSYDNESK